MSLTQWLVAKQAELGQSDAAFARTIGLSHSGWFRIRNGQRRPSIEVMRRAMNLWEESLIDICRAARIEEPTAA